MEHLNMKLPEILSPDLDLNTRSIVGLYGTYKEIKSKNACCICKVNFWVEDYPGHSYFAEGFKVIDPRAYENGILPDYLRMSNALKECHWACKQELEKNLNNNTFQD